MADIECPFGGICPKSCEGRPVAEGLAVWKAQHPIPDAPARLTNTADKKREGKRRKIIGTDTFLTGIACKQVKSVCENRQGRKGR